MADSHDHRILVPVDIFSGESVPGTLVEALASVPVVVLGYREIPEQTAPEQARSAHEAQAQAELEKLRTVFESAGCAVSTQLVFTRDRLQTFERVAVERDCDSILILNSVPILEKMLVAVRGDVNVDHVARLAATVLTDTEIDVTLLHVISKEENRQRGTDLLQDAASTIEAHGIDPDRIGTSVTVGKPTDAILDAATDHDLLVVGESRPSLRRFIFRDRANRIARRSVDPVIVVRRTYLESNGTNGEE